MPDAVPGSAARPLTRDNHFVPQFHLKRWSLDDETVFAYRLLVSNEAVPLWTRRSVRGLAVRRDLYTSVSDGPEDDKFERWVATESESPASTAIEKVVQGDRLKREDWHALARLYALQDVRTPLSYLEAMARWERDLPSF